MDQSLFTARGGEGGGVVEVSFFVTCCEKETHSLVPRSFVLFFTTPGKKNCTRSLAMIIYFFSSKVVVIQCVVQDDNTRALLILVLSTLFSLFKSSL